MPTKSLQCYPLVMMTKKYDDKTVNKGGKVILPPSILQESLNLEISVYPMLFKIRNPILEIETHCGVLEFIAEEGICYLPYWMIEFLGCNIGDLIDIKQVKLQSGEFVKFKIDDLDFFNILDKKIVLEQILKNYNTLTVNDVILFNYNNKDYNLQVLETKPSNAINITNCDLSVDFDLSLNCARKLLPKSEILYKNNKNVKKGEPYYDYKPGVISFKRVS